MKIATTRIATGFFTVLLVSSAAWAADRPGHAAPAHGEEVSMPNGVIGVSLQVGAERIGDPAVLYVAMVHPEGPAHRAGLSHGDELVTVDGTPVAGKTYEQVVRLIRGDAGTTVKLGVKGDAGTRDLSITRVASDSLPKGPMGSHGGAGK